MLCFFFNFVFMKPPEHLQLPVWLAFGARVLLPLDSPGPGWEPGDSSAEPPPFTAHVHRRAGQLQNGQMSAGSGSDALGLGPAAPLTSRLVSPSVNDTVVPTGEQGSSGGLKGTARGACTSSSQLPRGCASRGRARGRCVLRRAGGQERCAHE